MNAVNMELMIFDVRYKKIQAYGTIPNCLWIELGTEYTHEWIRQIVNQYVVCKSEKTTICVVGLSNLTIGSQTSTEKYHSWAVSDVIKEMEK